jgi:hypothetical protein
VVVVVVVAQMHHHHLHLLPLQHQELLVEKVVVVVVVVVVVAQMHHHHLHLLPLQHQHLLVEKVEDANVEKVKRTLPILLSKLKQQPHYHQSSCLPSSLQANNNDNRCHCLLHLVVVMEPLVQVLAQEQLSSLVQPQQAHLVVALVAAAVVVVVVDKEKEIQMDVQRRHSELAPGLMKQKVEM